MSFLAKIKQLMTKKQETINKVSGLDMDIQRILYPSSKGDMIKSKENIIIFLKINPEQTSIFIQSLQKINIPPNTSALYCLLEIFQILLSSSETKDHIAFQIKQNSFKWLNPEDHQQIDQERLYTEASTSSFVCPQIMVSKCQTPRDEELISHDKISSRQQQIFKKRQDKIGMNTNRDQSDQKIQTQPIAKKVVALSSQMFVKIYYQYLQKVSNNLDLLKAIGNQQYPFTDNQTDPEPLMQFLWLYKTQNLIGLALKLLETFQPIITGLQLILWNEVVCLQNFLLGKVTHLSKFQILSEELILQLLEIHSEAVNNHQLLEQFYSKAQITLELIPHFRESLMVPQTIEDFISQVQRTNIQDFQNNKMNEEKENFNIKDNNLVQNKKDKSHLRQNSGCPILNFNNQVNPKQFIKKINFDLLKINKQQVPQILFTESMNYTPVYETDNQNDYEMKYEKQVAQKVIQQKFDILETNESGLFEDQ